MVNFADLSDEIVLMIFYHLLQSEVRRLLEQLRGLKGTLRLVELLQARLFRECLILTDKHFARQESTKSIKEFVIKYQELDDPDRKYLINNPAEIEFKLTRDEDRGFGSRLNALEGILVDKELINQNAMDCLTVDILINCNFSYIASEYGLRMTVIRILMELSRSDRFKNKVKRISIEGTALGGTYYILLWSILFDKFANLESLNLSDNMIQSSYDEIFLNDTLSSFCFPPSLRQLYLDNNLINNFSVEFLSNLPSTLEILLMRKTMVPSINLKSYSLVSLLPNLNRLLFEDSKLRHIDPSCFAGLNNLTLNLRGCPLENMYALIDALESHQVTLMI